MRSKESFTTTIIYNMWFPVIYKREVCHVYELSNITENTQLSKK